MQDRPLNKKYGISIHRYKELIHFTQQYQEWKKEVKNSSGTKEAQLLLKISLVEETVQEAAGSLAPYMLEAITKKLTYENVRMTKNIPCGKNVFYEMRVQYFVLLDKKKG